MRSSSWAVLALMVGLTSAASAGVSVDYTKGADFSRFRSFSWIAVQAETAADPAVEKSLRSAVVEVLESKGLTWVEQGGDLLVRARIVRREEERVDVDILGYEGRWAGSAVPAGSPGEYLREVGVGTLVIDLLDGHSELQVWRGIAQAVARPEPGRKSEKRIEKAVRKLFAAFPPQQ
jgi:hypothetical protein